MRYYVIAPDGNKYGPATVETLRQWETEGRLNGDTFLEEEGTLNRFVARAVLFPQTTPSGEFSAPPPTTYPRGTSPQSDDGRTQLILGWVCAVVSVACCPIVFGVAAILLGNSAKKKGQQGGQALIVSAVVLMILGFVFGIYFAVTNPDLLRALQVG